MAIVIEEHSTCPICNEVLNRNKKYILVPPLISNMKDFLFNVSDSGVHVDCLERSGLQNLLSKHINLYHNALPLAKSRCIVDGMQIDEPKNTLFFGLLTSNDKEELYEFNYIAINIKNINNWKELNRFLSIAEAFLLAEKWVGFAGYNKLKNIVDVIKENLI